MTKLGEGLGLEGGIGLLYLFSFFYSFNFISFLLRFSCDPTLKQLNGKEEMKAS